LVLLFVTAGFRNSDMINLFKQTFILFGFVSLLFFSRCTNDLKDVMALPKNQLSPSLVGDTVIMLYTDSSQLKIMVTANRMLTFTEKVSEPFRILPKGFYVTFFDEKENVSATLKANYGIRYDNSRRMEAKYAVELVNKEGVKLETEKLTWHEYTKRIYTDAFVKITTDKEIIMGQGMESNQDFSKYELKKVTGIIQLKNDE
jgi:LPS export ABC transporter protein LptC